MKKYTVSFVVILAVLSIFIFGVVMQRNGIISNTEMPMLQPSKINAIYIGQLYSLTNSKITECVTTFSNPDHSGCNAEEGSPVYSFKAGKTITGFSDNHPNLMIYSNENTALPLNIQSCYLVIAALNTGVPRNINSIHLKEPDHISFIEVNCNWIKE